MTDPRIWYDVNCHCRLVRLRIHILPLYPSTDSSTTPPTKEAPTVQTVNECNCSICTKNGYLNIYPDDFEKDIEWISGKDELKRYEFATKAVGHMACPVCASSIILNVDTSVWMEKKGGGTKVGINARMIKNIDVDRLTLRKVDKAQQGEPYEK